MYVYKSTMASTVRPSQSARAAGADILVTADHKIRDPDSGRFIAVKDCKHATVTEQCGNTLSCLVTDDHLIPVGEFTFWDWED